MKRVFEHPPEPSTGRRYWRSVGELSDTPEFREWLEREFPAGAAQMTGDEVSRRSFLKLMGASMALAGLGLSSCRRPEYHLVPFTKSVEWVIPGKALYYATAMPRRTGALPLIATTIDGRPIKLDGNPLHPASSGASDAQAQAAVLDLYDPMRSKGFVHRGEKSDAAAFEKYLGELRARIDGEGGTGLAFVVEETYSPTRERLRAELEKRYPRMRWCTFEPLLSEAQNFSTQISFGDNSRLIPRYDRADVVLAVDSDFLDCGEGDLASIRAFTSRRRITQASDTMNRLYVVENRFSLTGAMADHRLRIPASQVPAFMQALAGKIAVATQNADLGSVIATLATPPGAMTFDERWLTEVANDLIAKSGASLVTTGPMQPVVVQLLAYAINAALKNVGTTLTVREFPRNPRTNSILQLSSEIAAGRIKQLFIFGGDPAYNAPRSLAEDRDARQLLDWEALQRKVPDVIRLGYYEDATSLAAQWHVPATHFLEEWGDALTFDGSYLAVQPMILPLWGGVSELEILNALLGGPPVKGPQLVQETFRAMKPPGNFDEAWLELLRTGFATHIQPKDKEGKFNANTAGGVAHNLWSAPPAPTLDSPEIVLVRSYTVDDGRYVNNGWLQEMPDPVTKLTWDNAALMSPAMARHLGVNTSDLIEITVTETMLGPDQQPLKRQLVIAAMVVPGHVDGSITIPLGYGRHIGPKGPLPYGGAAIDFKAPAGQGTGFNAYVLRTSTNPHYIAADNKTVKSVEIRKVPGRYELAVTQEHFSIEGRGLVREAVLDEYRKDPTFVRRLGGDEHLPPQLPSIYTPPRLIAQQQWGMAIDLNTCTGCSACVIACQAENNIPIVGKLQVTLGRSMHWLRIDRYFADEKPFNQDRGQFPQNPEMVHQPMMCQHCENAPCETVCPVNATVHSEDGLNVMTYNRCIGTRYCANNCPFKVRRFNYFDYNLRPVGRQPIVGKLGVNMEYLGPLTEKGAPDTMKLQKNPNVTVRMRGVMEKCTFCVQRIQEAKIEAQAAAGPTPNTQIPPDAFTTACAQACPTEAIVFGDIADPNTRVSKLKAQDRNYRLLEYLNVRTRASYLARIRNPNPAMPDAKRIGVASLSHQAHGDHDQEHNPGTLNPEPREPKQPLPVEDREN